MNWKVLKERFPNSYKEIRERHVKTKQDGRDLIDDFLESKGYKTGHTFINNLIHNESTY